MATPEPRTNGIRLQQILVATDLSDASRQAFPSAIGFARRFAAKLTLVHVFPTVLPAELSHIGLVFEQKRLAAEARQRLERFRATELPADLPVETVLLEGGPAHQLVTLAEDAQADLIILATHGHTGWQHLWLGSTAERVVRHAPCPVWTVRAPLVPVSFPHEEAVRFAQALVPTDLSPASETTLRYTAAFARACGTEVTLLHVMEPPPYPQFGYAHVPMEEAKRKHEVTVKLQAKCAQLMQSGVRADWVVRHGNAYREVVEQAREGRADFILIGSHAHRVLAHALIGSTAEHIVRHAPCPVLVVREREREFLQG